MYKLVASLFEYWLTFLGTLERFMAGETVWIRRTFKKGDGSVGVFLAKHSHVEKATKIEFQDVSQDYWPYLQVLLP